MARARLSAFALVRPRGDRDQATAHHQRGVRGRGGPARLHRAHQHPRQHPHARLRHPPRIRYRRGRRIQPRADRSRRAAAEEPQLLQDRQDHQRAGLGARPRRHQCRRRREIRPANSRCRAAIRPRTASWPRSASANATCSVGASTPEPRSSTANVRRGFEVSFAEPYFLGYRVWRRRRSLRQADACAPNYVSYDSETVGGAVSRRVSASPRKSALQLRYNIYRQEITLPIT